MDSLPWPAITVASGGWSLFGALAWYVVTRLIRGDLHTDREMEAKDDENLRLRASNDHLQEQLGQSLTGLKTMNDALTAIRSAVEDKP